MGFLKENEMLRQRDFTQKGVATVGLYFYNDTVKPRIKEPVNFDFRLKWFLYNRYLEKKLNQAEVFLI